MEIVKIVIVELAGIAVLQMENKLELKKYPVEEMTSNEFASDVLDIGNV